MLTCGKVIGYLSKVTRRTHTNHLHRPLKYVGIIGLSNARYSNSSDDKKAYKPPGTTIAPEECVPPSKYSKQKKQLPACEATADGTCPPSCYEICGPQDTAQKGTAGDSGGNGDGNKYKPPRYWKHLVAALVITGVAIYALSSSSLSTSEKARSKKISNNKKVDIIRRRKRSKEKKKSPVTSKSIPPEVPYLLIGGGTAAFSAFRSIKSKDPKAKVLVVTEEEDLPYMRPPLSKELWYNTDRAISAQLNFKQWNGTTRSLFYEPPEFYADVSNLMQSDKGGVAVATGWKVAKIDVPNKTALLEDGYEIKYDKCLIATGASAKNLPVFDSAEEKVKERIMTFRTKEDFLELEHNLHLADVKNIVIIGGGFLGSELACSLARNLGDNKKVFQIYKEKSIMAQVLPEYLSEWATKKCKLEGVHCIPNAEVEDYTFRDGRLSLTLNGGHSIEADQVIVAVGVEPNTDLALPSHLEVNPDIGGFLVNAELEARSDVWVAGDAACFYDVKLGRRRVEHHDHAVVSGRLAGENMTGAGKPYLHQSMFWSDLGPEVGYEAIGVVDSSLPTVGVFAKATDKDTPLAAVSATNEGIQSTNEEASSGQTKASDEGNSASRTREESAKNPGGQDGDDLCLDVAELKQSGKSDDFGKGVIFYLRDDIVVGIVLWNVFSRMSIARQVLARGTTYKDLNEVAKLFTIHED